MQISRVRAGFIKFSKVMEIDNAIFQDLESFREVGCFKMATESFEFLFGKILQHSKN